MQGQLLATLGREEGQDLYEYVLVMPLIVLVAVAALTLMGRNISPMFARAAGAV